jgi:hypothetical protein
MVGLPSLPPSEMNVDSYGICKLAMSTLAEAFEEREHYQATLPLFKKLVKQAEIAWLSVTKGTVNLIDGIMDSPCVAWEILARTCKPCCDPIWPSFVVVHRATCMSRRAGRAG